MFSRDCSVGVGDRRVLLCLHTKEIWALEVGDGPNEFAPCFKGFSLHG